MADAGLLSVKLTADDAQLLAALARSRAAVKATGEQVTAGMGVFKQYGATIAGLVSGGAVALFIKSTNETIDTQAKLARQVGGTTAAIQTLARAGDLAGVSAEDLSGAAGKLNVKLGQALEGTGSATGALKALGLTAQQLSSMDIDQRFAAIADAIAGAGITAQQTSSILRDLGIKQESIISLMEGGGDAIRNARKEVEGFGVAVSEIDAAKIEAGNDAMTSIMLTARGVATQISIQLAPVLQEIGTLFGDAAKSSHGFRDSVIPTIEAVAKGIAYVGDAMRGWQMLWEALKVGANSAVAFILEQQYKIPLGIADAIDKSIANINLLIAAANAVGDLNIPPIKLSANVGPIKAMREAIADVRLTAEESRKNLERMAAQDMPTDKVDAFFAAVKKRADDAAKAVVDARKGMGGTGVLDTTDPKEVKDTHDKGAAEIESMRVSALSDQARVVGELQEKYNKLNAILEKNPELQMQAGAAAAEMAAQYQQTIDTQIALGQTANQSFLDDMAVRVEAIQVQNDTELEMTMTKYATDQELLEEALLNRVITEAEYQEISAQQQKAHDNKILNMKLSNWEDLKNLTKLSWQSQLSIVTGTLTSMTATMATKNRAMFEINKVASASNAAMRIPDMMSAAYNAMVGIPYVGPVLGAAAAIAAGAFGAAQVSSIMSTSYGSGAKSSSSGVPSASIGGAGSAEGAAGVAGQGPTATAHTLKVEEINPDGLFSGKTMRAFAEKLLDYQRDGGQVVLA